MYKDLLGVEMKVVLRRGCDFFCVYLVTVKDSQYSLIEMHYLRSN